MAALDTLDAPADVRHGYHYSLDELRKEARALIERKKLTREEVGAMLEKPISGAAVSRALSENDQADYPGVLIRIIEALSDYRIEQRYQALRKGTGAQTQP